MNGKVLLGALVLIGALFAAEASVFGSSSHRQRWQGVDAGLCDTCIQFSEQAINNLLNIILNAGVVGGCSEVCGLLANKTGSKALGSICNVLCDIVGVKAFADLIEKADLDPIYLCELLKTCSINDLGDAKISNFTVTPAKGPMGTTFSFELQYGSKNGTGTGELYAGVKTVDGIPLSSTYLLDAQPAGNYSANIKVKAKADPNCDPTQQPCENWLAGNYSMTVMLCNGECSSKHPHSQIYDQHMLTFEVTEN